MSYFIIAKVQVEGFHVWIDAPREVDFLSYKHRHIFTIEAKRSVLHADRAQEFILLGRAIKAHLNDQFGTGVGVNGFYQYCNFGAMSCEQIAELLCIKFNLISCIVWEDGENAGGFES